jgi:heat shock protein HslJ
MLRPYLILFSASLLVLPACNNHSEERTAEAAPVASEPAASTAEAAEILGVDWEWFSTVTPVERVEAQKPENYTLRLQAEGTAIMRFDCNRGSGSYELSGNLISFGPMVSTRRACPADSQDFVYMGQLEKITSYFVQDGNLFLEMPYDSGTMRFRPASVQD